VKDNIIKTYILPIFWIFLIPLSSYLFFNYAVQERNDQINEFVLNSIESDAAIKGTTNVIVPESFKNLDYAAICNGTNIDFEIFKTSLGETCNDFEYYNIAIEISGHSIFLSIALIVCLVGLFILSFKSQTIQYLTFVVAWNISKLFCIVQVLVQGGLLMAIIYFGPILLWSTFYPQVLFIVAIPIALSCFQMIAVLVKNIKTPNHISGKLLKQEDSPLLYDELKTICKKFKTDLPDNIVLGIEDSFFVTENELLLNEEEKLTGKTLYASLFHLKKLDKQEASAILAHEMAHFSGEDTFFSKKTMPMLATCDAYFTILYENFITLPAFYFLLFFRSIFEISFGKISRKREYRADFMAVEHVGAEALSNGLVKFVFYSEYRANLEDTILAKSEQIADISFLTEIDEGVKKFAKNFNFNEGILEQEISHPFDSHPPISKRIAAVNHTLQIENIREDVLTNEEDSWYNEINNAQAMEAELMQSFENEFLEVHEENLAYQFLPSTRDETELVERYFPPVNINSKNEKETLVYNCKTFKYSTWGREIGYDEVESYHVHKPLFRKKRMSFKMKENPDFPGESRRIFFHVNSFCKSEEEIFGTFLMYSSRYTAALIFQNIEEG